MEGQVNIRSIVLTLLLTYGQGESFANQLLKGTLDKYNYLPEQEKAFLKRLFEGVIEREYYLDHVLRRYIKTPLSKVKRQAKVILRMGIYQLLWMDRVPESAACNEAVKLCKKQGMQALSGFVNGVMRAVARDKQRLQAEKYTDLPEYENGHGFAKAVSIYYSMPEFLVRKWEDTYGRERTEQMVQAFADEDRPVTIRLRTDIPDTQTYLEQARTLGIEMKQHPYLPYAYTVSGSSGIARVPGFAEGVFYVQDVSSMLVCEVAGIAPGMQVIDVCSAPGGKGLHARSLGAHVSARDVSEDKVRLIRENATRLGYLAPAQQEKAEFEILMQDARQLRTEDVGRADVVLADVPCSGYGIIGKKCDIKYSVSPEKEEALLTLQKEILDSVSTYVKPGGVLMYSTCTINQRENEAQLSYLQQKGFTLESIEEALPIALRGQSGAEGYLQLLPGIHMTDGFFLAKLRKAR